MLRLLAFIRQYLHLILFLLLQVLCLILLFQLNPYQKAYFSNSFASVTANVNAMSTGVVDYFNLGTQNQILQEALKDSLRKQIPGLSLHYLGDTFDVNDSVSEEVYKLIPAQVVFNSVHKAENVFVINKGSINGVTKGSGVVSPSGVAGVITAVGERFSMAMSVLNVNFRIVPQINNAEFFTEIIWDNANPYTLKINKINKLEKLKKGDLVSTGQSSLIFPAGIPIGYIANLQKTDESQYYDTDITTATDFRNLNYVFVLNHNFKSEIESLLDHE